MKEVTLKVRYHTGKLRNTSSYTTHGTRTWVNPAAYLERLLTTEHNAPIHMGAVIPLREMKSRNRILCDLGI